MKRVRIGAVVSLTTSCEATWPKNVFSLCSNAWGNLCSRSPRGHFEVHGEPKGINNTCTSSTLVIMLLAAILVDRNPKENLTSARGCVALGAVIPTGIMSKRATAESACLQLQHGRDAESDRHNSAPQTMSTKYGFTNSA